MKSKKPFLPIGYIGIAIVLLALTIMSIFPRIVPYMAEGFRTPIIFFEFVRTVGETQRLFGMFAGFLPDDNLVQQMDLGNKIDFIYAFVYGTFLFMFARKLVKVSGKKLFIVVMVLAVVAMVFDWLENIKLITITEKLADGSFQDDLDMLHIYTWIKWGSLAASFLILSDWWFKGGWISKTFSFIAWAPAILGVLAYRYPGFYSELFAYSIMIMFVGTILYCFVYKEPQNTVIKE